MTNSSHSVFPFATYHGDPSVPNLGVLFETKRTGSIVIVIEIKVIPLAIGINNVLARLGTPVRGGVATLGRV
jgi:hypothetical protein